MHLVDEDGLAHQPQVPHQNVPRFQGCQQHLVDRPDHDRWQSRPPPQSHPPAGVQPAVSLDLIVALLVLIVVDLQRLSIFLKSLRNPSFRSLLP